MDTAAFLSDISEASCISEAGSARDKILSEIRRYSPEAYIDRLGSIIAPVSAPKGDGVRLLLDAHIDEVGFIVTRIDDGGFLHITKVGGPDLKVLLGSEVTVHGRKPLFGLFCCRPPHLSGPDDCKKAPETDELAVDIGYTAQKASELVSPGDYVTFRRKPKVLPGGLISGKSLDNRAGVAVILRALDLLGKKAPAIGLTAVFSMSEELGERGATAAAYAVEPTQALVVDTSFAMTPDSPREKCGNLRGGPMIGVSPVLSKAVTDRLFDLARSLSIPFQTEVMGGSTGTNSDVISDSRSGVETGLLSVPLRYMHTANELISLEDIENTARLMAAYIETAGGADNA